MTEGEKRNKTDGGERIKLNRGRGLMGKSRLMENSRLRPAGRKSITPPQADGVFFFTICDEYPFCEATAKKIAFPGGEEVHEGTEYRLFCLIYYV
jgi:hypothetical protein